MHSPRQSSAPRMDGAEPQPGLYARLDRLATSLERVEGTVASIAAGISESARPATANTDGRATQETQAVQRPNENATDVGTTQSAILKEDVISFVAASELMPLSVRRHPATISRWATRGVRGVRLESVYVGGRRVTSKQAFARFLEACRKHDFQGIANGDELEKAMATVLQLRTTRRRRD